MEQLLGFSRVNHFGLNDNVFDLLDNQWMLITAGKVDNFNTMTASWGGFGILWNKPIATIFIRPQRYTLKFVEETDSFSLSFLPDDYKAALNICGSRSGKNTNKVKEAGLNPVLTPNGLISFKEARLILECKKIYSDSIKSANFIDTSIVGKVYPNNDFHKFFIGEITGCYEVG